MVPRSPRLGLLSSRLHTAGVAQSAEHLHGKEGVSGSNPDSGSDHQQVKELIDSRIFWACVNAIELALDSYPSLSGDVARAILAKAISDRRIVH
jgi:hypothetical protein